MSSESESDEDYVPGEPEKLSEEESADEETEKQYVAECDHKSKKRKVFQKQSENKKLKTTKQNIKENEGELQKDKELDEKLDPEEEKKREEDLWAKFLEGTDTKPKPKQSITCIEQVKPLAIQDKVKLDIKQKDDAKEREKRIFEFAGETIVVEDNVIKERIKTNEGNSEAVKLDGPSQTQPGKSGGISNILGKLNKKNKLSTLEKSKLDWTTYKKEEGIEDEIRSHNKGKNGFLERRDFLERADMRQYEIERELRMSRRSNR